MKSLRRRTCLTSENIILQFVSSDQQLFFFSLVLRRNVRRFNKQIRWKTDWTMKYLSFSQWWRLTLVDLLKTNSSMLLVQFFFSSSLRRIKKKLKKIFHFDQLRVGVWQFTITERNWLAVAVLFLENWNWRPVLFYRTGTGDQFFFTELELEASSFLQNWNWRPVLFYRTGTGDQFFFTELELETSSFLQNWNWRPVLF